MYKDIDSQMALTRMAPGAQEAALLERVSGLLLESSDSYDRIVFDTAPTGSTLRLLSLPEVMTAWMEGLLKRRDMAESFRERLRGMSVDEEEGPGGRKDASGRQPDPRAQRIRKILDGRRNRFSRARRILQDPDRSAFVLVVIPEKLAILEGHRAFRSLTAAQIPVTGVVVNRVLPEGDLGDFLESRRRQERAYLDEIDEKFSRIPRARVALMEEDVGNLEGLKLIAESLASRSA
jgi:arsenite-transporting ATPase